MKKAWYWMLLLICLTQFLTGCSGGGQYSLELDKIKDGEEYVWPGIEYGMTVAEAEEAVGAGIETVPYSSSYGERINMRYDGTEPAVDYRTSSDYEFAEFYMTDQDKGVTVEYGGGKGYLCLLFKQGGLCGARVLWGTQNSKRDSLLEFEKSKNDPDAIFNALEKEMIQKYGDPERENKGAELHTLVWTLGETNVTIARLYQSDSGEAVSITISQAGN